jgi:hypothetical protein
MDYDKNILENLKKRIGLVTEEVSNDKNDVSNILTEGLFDNIKAVGSGISHAFDTIKKDFKAGYTDKKLNMEFDKINNFFDDLYEIIEKYEPVMERLENLNSNLSKYTNDQETVAKYGNLLKTYKFAFESMKSLAGNLKTTTDGLESEMNTAQTTQPEPNEPTLDRDDFENFMKNPGQEEASDEEPLKPINSSEDETDTVKYDGDSAEEIFTRLSTGGFVDGNLAKKLTSDGLIEKLDDYKTLYIFTDKGKNMFKTPEDLANYIVKNKLNKRPFWKRLIGLQEEITDGE